MLARSDLGILLAGSVLLAGIVGVVIAPIANQSPPPAPMTEPVEDAAPAPAPKVPFVNAATIRKADDGHFWAAASVDGYPVKFMIDTGASTVALTLRDAQRLGYAAEDLDFKWEIRTAGGVTYGAYVLLDTVKIGQVEVHNIDAMVLREELGQSLLGMSFLNELYSYEFRQKQLIIRQ